MKFSDVIKTLCLCGCVFGSMCEDVVGVDTNHLTCASSLIIRDVNDFIQMDQTNMGHIKSITFLNIDIDRAFYTFAEKLWSISDIHFYNCRLREGLSFYNILNSCPIENLSIVNSGLTTSDISEIFCILPQEVNSLDFSENNLGTQEPSILYLLRDRGWCPYIKMLNLSKNNLPSKLQRSIRDYVSSTLSHVSTVKL